MKPIFGTSFTRKTLQTKLLSRNQTPVPRKLTNVNPLSVSLQKPTLLVPLLLPRHFFCTKHFQEVCKASDTYLRRMVKNSMEDGEGDLMVDTPAYQVWHSLVSPLAPSWPLHSILHHYNLPPAPTLHNVGTFVIFLAVLQVYLSSLFVSASHPRLKPPHNNRFFGRRERFAASIVSIPQKSSMLSGQTRKHLPTACLNRCASPSRASSRRLRCLQVRDAPDCVSCGRLQVLVSARICKHLKLT